MDGNHICVLVPDIVSTNQEKKHLLLLSPALSPPHWACLSTWPLLRCVWDSLTLVISVGELWTLSQPPWGGGRKVWTWKGGVSFWVTNFCLCLVVLCVRQFVWWNSSVDWWPLLAYRALGCPELSSKTETTALPSVPSFPSQLTNLIFLWTTSLKNLCSLCWWNTD